MLALTAPKWAPPRCRRASSTRRSVTVARRLVTDFVGWCSLLGWCSVLGQVPRTGVVDEGSAVERSGHGSVAPGGG